MDSNLNRFLFISEDIYKMSYLEDHTLYLSSVMCYASPTGKNKLLCTVLIRNEALVTKPEYCLR